MNIISLNVWYMVGYPPSVIPMTERVDIIPYYTFEQGVKHLSPSIPDCFVSQSLLLPENLVPFKN